MDKKSNIWWDQSTMRKYLKDGMVPRKLRWDVPINDGLLGDDDVEEWYTFFAGKGREIMEFLMKRKQRKLNLLENQIKDIRDKLNTFINNPEYTRLMGELHRSMQKKDTENKNAKKKKYQRDFEDYQNKQVFRWQSTLASNTATNSQPQTGTAMNGHMAVSQPQGQLYSQQQNNKQFNRGYPPHRQDDALPHTPYRQLPKKSQYNQQRRPSNEGRNGPPPNQGNWGYGASTYQDNGYRAQYEGDHYDRSYPSNPPPQYRGGQQNSYGYQRQYGYQHSTPYHQHRSYGYQHSTPHRGNRIPYRGPPPYQPPFRGYPPNSREDTRRGGAYYSPKPQRVRYEKPQQDQYRVPVTNSFQPLGDNEHFLDESFLGGTRGGPTRETRNPGREEGELDEEYNRKRRRED